MPEVVDAIGALRDRRVQQLNDLHDEYDHTRKLWRMLQIDVERYKRSLTFHNSTTGSRLGGEELAGLAGATLARLNERTFKDMIGQFEFFATELMRIWLTAHPELLTEKALTVKTLLDAKTLGEAQRAAVHDAIESTILNKAYDAPAKWFNYLHKLLKAKVIVDSDVERFGEMKARRDVLEHAGGVVNQLYVGKSGANAKWKVGERVELRESDLSTAYSFLKQLITNVSKAAIAAG